MNPVEPAPRPAQITNAVTLLWFSLLISLPSWYLAAERSPEPADPLATALSLGLLALFAWLNVRLSKGARWARSATLVLTIAGMLLNLVAADEAVPPGLFETVLGDVDLLISLLALYWLYSGPGAAWFRKPES